MKLQKLALAGSALLVAVTPVIASAASATANTTINATVADVISITTSGTVAISLTPTTGGVVSSASDTVTVNSNRTTGYNLKISDSDSNANLVSSGNTMTPHSGTFASPTALTSGKWGYRIVGVGGFTATAYSAESNNGSSSSTWAGVSVLASPVTVKTTSSPATNDVTTVWYAAKADSTQPNGTYTDTVTYTATNN
jgi:hypothetical protein